MVQSTVGGFFWQLQSWWFNILGLLPAFLLVLGIALTMALVLYTMRQNGFFALLAWLNQNTKIFFRWWPVLPIMLLVLPGIEVAHQSIGLRYASQNNAQFSKQEDPPGHDTMQAEPTAYYTETKHYTRSIRVPPDALKRLDGEGREAILPYVQQYLADPQSRNVQAVVDSIVRNGKSLYFVREADISEQRFIALDSSNIKTDFEFASTGLGRNYYNAKFIAQYSFANPLDTALETVFFFPFPQNSGVLKDFYFEAKGEIAKEVRPYTNGYTWYAKLKPKETVVAKIKYTNQGSDTWNYKISGREVINNFKLEAHSAKPVKFLRGSLYPNQTGENMVWNFPKIVTAQGITIGFPENDIHETINKVFAFMRFVLLAALLWLVLFAQRYNLLLTPKHLALAIFGLALGFAASAVMMGYFNPVLALSLGAILAGVLGCLALGKNFVVPVVAVCLAPLAYLTNGNAGLCFLLLALLVFASLLPQNLLGKLLRVKMGEGNL